MRYRFETEQQTYVANYFNSMAHGDGVNRPLRRNLLRLANKFSGPRSSVFLKPLEKAQVIYFCDLGLKMMDTAYEKEGISEDEKAHILKVAGIVTDVLAKLRGEFIGGKLNGTEAKPCSSPVGDSSEPANGAECSDLVSGPLGGAQSDAGSSGGSVDTSVGNN